MKLNPSQSLHTKVKDNHLVLTIRTFDGVETDYTDILVLTLKEVISLRQDLDAALPTLEAIQRDKDIKQHAALLQEKALLQARLAEITKRLEQNDVE